MIMLESDLRPKYSRLVFHLDARTEDIVGIQRLVEVWIRSVIQERA